MADHLTCDLMPDHESLRFHAKPRSPASRLHYTQYISFHRCQYMQFTLHQWNHTISSIGSECLQASLAVVNTAFKDIELRQSVRSGSTMHLAGKLTWHHSTAQHYNYASLGCTQFYTYVFNCMTVVGLWAPLSLLLTGRYTHSWNESTNYR